MINKQGGQSPTNPEQLTKAEKADLITLPPKVQGTNCANCQFYRTINQNGGQCTHPKVLQIVNKRNCCSLWNAEGTYRPWKENGK